MMPARLRARERDTRRKLSVDATRKINHVARRGVARWVNVFQQYRPPIGAAITTNVIATAFAKTARYMVDLLSKNLRNL